MNLRRKWFCVVGLTVVTALVACSAKVSPDTAATGQPPKRSPQPIGPTSGRLKEVIKASCTGSNGSSLRMNMQTGEAEYQGKKGQGKFSFIDNSILSSPYGDNVNDGYYSLVYTSASYPDGSGANIGLASYPNKLLGNSEDLLAVSFSVTTYVFSYEKMHCQLEFQPTKVEPPPPPPPAPVPAPSPVQPHQFTGGNFHADSASGCDVSLIAENSGGELSLLASFKPPCGGALVNFVCNGSVCDDSGVMQIRIIDADHFRLTDSMARQSGYPTDSSYTRKN